MAKRRRLSPARPGLAGDAPRPPAAFVPSPIAGVAGDAAGAAAAEELARTLHEARIGGRMVLDLDLDRIDAGYLVRDRVTVDEAEMQVLMASIAARGQQAPVDVADLGGGRYGLISGWRRLEALRRLGPEGGPNTILALLRQPREAGDAYLAMVEENEIRVGLSYYERARIALKAVEQGAYTDTKKALLSLYHAASRPKRSKIGSFLGLVEELDGALTFPGALGERLGLQLARSLDDDPTLAARLRRLLAEAVPEDAEAEKAMLQQALAGSTGAAVSGKAAPVAPRNVSRAKHFTPSQPLVHITLRPGLTYVEHRNGGVTLEGPAVDADLRARLTRWLGEQLDRREAF